MKHTPFVLTFISLAILGGCNKAPDVEQSAKVENVAAQTEVMPPIAKKVPYEMTIHGDTRTDDYYWMRDDERKAPEVISYLEAENAYTDEMLAHTKTLQSSLFEELKGRIQKDDDSVPVKDGEYYYSSQTRGDNEYATYLRSSDFAGTDQEVILDVNELAKGHDYFAVSGLSVSPNDNLMAYGEDTVSRRVYNIKIKDLSTGKLLEDTIEGTSG